MFFNFHIDLIYNAQWSAYTKARQTLDVNFGSQHSSITITMSYNLMSMNTNPEKLVFFHYQN